MPLVTKQKSIAESLKDEFPPVRLNDRNELPVAHVEIGRTSPEAGIEAMLEESYKVPSRAQASYERPDQND